MNKDVFAEIEKAEKAKKIVGRWLKQRKIKRAKAQKEKNNGSNEHLFETGKGES